MYYLGLPYLKFSKWPSFCRSRIEQSYQLLKLNFGWGCWEGSSTSIISWAAKNKTPDPAVNWFSKGNETTCLLVVFLLFHHQSVHRMGFEVVSSVFFVVQFGPIVSSLLSICFGGCQSAGSQWVGIIYSCFWIEPVFSRKNPLWVLRQGPTRCCLSILLFLVVLQCPVLVTFHDQPQKLLRFFDGRESW